VGIKRANYVAKLVLLARSHSLCSWADRIEARCAQPAACWSVGQTVRAPTRLEGDWPMGWLGEERRQEEEDGD